MVKKTDFSKYGYVLKRMMVDKSGQTNPPDEEELRAEIISEEQRRRERSERETVEEQAQREHNYRMENKRFRKQEKDDEEREEKEEKRGEKWKVTRAKEWVEGKGKRAKEVMRGDIAGAGGEVGGWMFILMTVMLYIFDMFFRYNGINAQRFLDNLRFTSVESYIGWFFNSIVLTLLIAYWVLYRPDTKEFISWFLVAEALSLIIFMGGMGSMLIHLSFVITFYFLYIRYSAKEGAGGYAGANYIFFFLLVFDFFGYGILAEIVKNPIVSNRLIIPIWFYFALIYTHEKERSFWINMVIVIVILMNVFYFVGGIDGLRSMSATLTTEEKQEGINFLRTGWKNFADSWKQALEGLSADMDAQLIQASGGYYQGKVEKNKIGPLGVFINKLKTSQPRYYEKEKVIIWGTVEALSLGEGINVEIKCHKKDEEKYATEVIPKEQPFTMYSKEIRDFECVFDPSEEMETPWYADLGIHTIAVDAEFNFGTLAYLKSYFIDTERKRDMVREGLDPFKEFGIKDTEPIAVYTDGPVIIGMETTSPIIDVGQGAITQPRLGVTLENKEGWEGVIRNLSELVILTPPGVNIDLNSEPCTFGFEKYGIKNCEEDSCVNLEYNPCMKVCGSNPEESCETKCEKVKESCISDCKVMFGENEEEVYTGYSLDVNKLEPRDAFKDIDRFRSFSCRLNVEESVLGNTPITVKYFRAKARYNYVVSKDIDVQIQSAPGTAGKVSEKVEISELVPGDIGKKIETHASSILGGGYVDLALALAWDESWHRHCCKDKGNKGDGCEGTHEDDCYEEKLISSGSSFGVMQLNKEVHCPWFHPVEICEESSAKKNVNYGTYGCSSTYDEDKANSECATYYTANCVGKDATNVDCNIKLGLRYLKKLYDEGQQGYLDGKFYDCNGKTYSGWDYALRAYNGWSCEGQADLEFVENVNDYKASKPWKEYETQDYTQDYTEEEKEVV